MNAGHVIVATKEAGETILDLSEAAAGALFQAAAKIARAVDRAFKPDGITILHANKPAGWQTVPHAHLHILPRWKDDGVTISWPRQNPPLDELRALAAKIKFSSRER